MARALIVLLLLAAPSVVAQTTAKGEPCKYIGLYEVRHILLPRSTRLGDTLAVGLRVLLDCTMEVTRVSTSFRKNHLTLALYGTYWRKGCENPLCPAREVTHTVKIRPRDRGRLTITVRNPRGKYLTSAVKVR